MMRFHVRFRGGVQGVGFRATTRNIARDFAVAGQVRNMPDGSVELIVEGQQQQLEALVEAIVQQMRRNITRHVVDRSPATGAFGSPAEGTRSEVVIAY